MRVYGYLRASTKEQDAKRAKKDLSGFAERTGSPVSTWFIEHESGATLKRPELFRLLEVAQAGDVLLVEQVDRISRLTAHDWEALKATITGKGIRVVALDLPTSHQLMHNNADAFTGRMLAAINAMMLDMLAAVARKDYEDRRRRQAQGIKRAREEKKYKGRPVDQKLRDNISALLRDGKSWNAIIELLGCSRATIAKVKKAMQPDILDSGLAKRYD